VARLGPEAADEQLHTVRKAVKRARCAAELAAEARVPGAASYAKRAKRVQDILGDHQDAVTAQATLTELAGNAPTAGEKLRRR